MKAFISIVILAIVSADIVNASVVEKKLITKILENYSTIARPVPRPTESMDVKFGLSLLSVQAVNEKEGSIETNLWLTIKWTDHNLRWNPDEYDGIRDLRIPISHIWKPDIHAYNSVHDLFDVTYETKTVVLSNGSVTYVPPGIHKTSCQVDFVWYPLEYITCDFKFGSWVYDGGQLNLTLNEDRGGDLSSYIPNSQWHVDKFPAVRNAIYYVCCPDPYVDVTFSLHIQRKGESILWNYKIVNAFICLLMLISFIMSPSSGQKIVLGVGAMVCNIWVFSSINSALGINSYSYLAWYFEKLAALALSSIVANLLVILVNSLTFPMPAVISGLFQKLPPFLLLLCPSRGQNTSNDSYGRVTNAQSSANNRPRPSTDDSRDLLAEVGQLKRNWATASQKAVNEDWILLARILDRCFFVIYAFCILIYITAVFPSYPSNNDD